MHARYHGKAVHSLGKPSNISPARAQAILSSVSGNKTGSISASVENTKGVDQDVVSVGVDLDSDTTAI